MPHVAVEILLILVLIIANGAFSLSEIAVVSSRKARLQQFAEAGDPSAAAALKLANKPDDFLSTVQVGITLVGILTGAFSGATVARLISERIAGVSWLAPYKDGVALGLVVAVTTYLSLVIGELVPKRIGLSNPERIAARVAVPMQALSRAASPLVWLLGVSSNALCRLLGMRPSSDPPVTEEELKVILQQGAEAGVFETTEQQMVEGIFRLTDRRVGMLATPRTDVAWLDLNDSPETVRQRIVERRHSHFAVCEGDSDHVVGIVHTKDLLVRCLEGKPFDLRECMEPALFVPENMRIARLLELFRESRRHLAVVLEERGGTHGLITLVDVMEAIVGDLPLAGEETPPGIVQREDGSWLVDGLLQVDALKDALDLRELPGEDTGTYGTVGGLVATHLGRIPETGDHFEWQGLRFEVIDMDGRRVDKVLISRIL